MKKTKLILIATAAIMATLLAGCPEPPIIDAGTLTLSPEAGIYTTDQSVTISCSTADAVIHYTIDGSEPDATSTVYSEPINITGPLKQMDIKAVSICEGVSSSVITGRYTVDSTVYPAMKGSITTGTGVDITKIKVGLFFKGHADGPNPTTNISLSDDVVVGRVFHSDAAITDGDAVSITPSKLGTIETTASIYALSIPTPPPDRSGTTWSEGYYALAWYDTDGDGNLDLKDGDATAYADQGEYNRMPVKSVELNGNADTSCYIDFIEQNELDATGFQFKYYNVADKDDYAHIGLTSSTIGDFNFTIDAVTDTN